MTLVGGHRIGTFGRDHDHGLAAVACACSESIFACSESVCDCIYWGLGGTVSKMFPRIVVDETSWCGCEMSQAGAMNVVDAVSNPTQVTFCPFHFSLPFFLSPSFPFSMRPSLCVCVLYRDHC